MQGEYKTALQAFDRVRTGLDLPKDEKTARVLLDDLELELVAVQSSNRYVEEKKPWALAKSGATDELNDCLSALLQTLRLCSVLCIPFMPVKSAEMRRQLELPDDVTQITLDEARELATGRTNWPRVAKPEVLFPKLEVPDEG